MKAVVLTILITLLRAFIVFPPAALAQQSLTDPEYGLCNTASFSSDDASAVQNLDAVAQSLIQNSSRFLYSLASSETGSQASYVYGMYQCRGDLSLSNCSSCVIHALTGFGDTGMAAICKNLSRGAQAYYHRGCYLRYENYKFSSGNEEDGTLKVPPSCFGSSMDSSSLYQQNVQTALEDSAAAAPKHPLFGYDATSVGSGSNTAYVLTQCLGYLNSSQCAACLSFVSNNTVACNRSASGTVFFNDCYYLFSNTSFVLTSNNSLPSKERRKNHRAAIVGIVVGVCVVLAGIATLIGVYALQRRNKLVNLAREIYKPQGEQLLNKPGAKGFTRFSVKELQDATDNFHPNNKLGEGGYGPVYQGKLKSGLEVAIKMLSARSHQGKSEFINEVSLITTVQHRNLIRLIGCCVDDNKPLLVYEYLPNQSLDLHLFGAHEKKALDWHTRFNIIVGIARGLRYLHEDSPVRIVHRDIKASNILLDNDFNPKIADFGLARLIADDRSHLTTRVAGTLGYLAPEYVINGQLTEKADVYSFGLMALEIVSGRKVMEPKYEENKQNLLDWQGLQVKRICSSHLNILQTWASYEKQQHSEIVDARMQKAESSSDAIVSMHVNVEEVIRVVHVALLCTQLQPQARPSMSEAHNMLCGQAEIVNLPTKRMTIGMPSPITDILHESSSTLPLWTSQPSDQPTHSHDADQISQVEPR